MAEQIAPLELLLNQQPEESSLQFTPKTFADYLGQEELKKKLSIYVQAAKQRNEPLDHLLLFGPPGLGKTTLSQIMACELAVGIKICSGPTLERTGDLVAILSSLQPKDLLFIDEIHRMPTHVEEMLYNAMEHFRVDVIIGQGAGAKSINLPIQPFTLVGATTKSGMLSAPLRSRFGITERLDFYTEEELALIVEQNAKFLHLTIEHDAALLIATASRGTPRTAKKMLRRVRDIAQMEEATQLNMSIVLHALTLLGIDSDGLSTIDNTLLRIMLIHFDGGPVGLDTLAAMLSEDKQTLEEVYEPFLMRKGYLEKTPRGRQIPYKSVPYLRTKFLGQHTLL